MGGVEASLRRLSHYDYWSNTLKPSILFDSQTNLLIYGMGEKPLIELVDRLQKGASLMRYKIFHKPLFAVENIHILFKQNGLLKIIFTRRLLKIENKTRTKFSGY